MARYTLFTMYSAALSPCASSRDEATGQAHLCLYTLNNPISLSHYHSLLYPPPSHTALCSTRSKSSSSRSRQHFRHKAFAQTKPYNPPRAPSRPFHALTLPHNIYQNLESLRWPHTDDYHIWNKQITKCHFLGVTHRSIW